MPMLKVLPVAASFDFVVSLPEFCEQPANAAPIISALSATAVIFLTTLFINIFPLCFVMITLAPKSVKVYVLSLTPKSAKVNTNVVFCAKSIKKKTLFWKMLQINELLNDK